MSDLSVFKKDKDLLVSELQIAGAVFSGTSYKCVHHDDSKASAGIFLRDDGWHWMCQACGEKGDVFDIIAKNEGKPVADIIREFGKPVEKSLTREQLLSFLPAGKKTIYEYRKLDGSIQCLVLRSDTANGKNIKQAHPSGDGFAWGGGAKPAVLYNALNVTKSDGVIIVEGEKAADALNDNGFCATTSLGGAANPTSSDWSLLNDKDVILWADNDEAGKRYMENVKQYIKPKSLREVSVEHLGLNEKDDAFDFIANLDKSVVKEALDYVFNEVCVKTEKVTKYSKYEKYVDDYAERKVISVPMLWRNVGALTKAFNPGAITILCGNPGASKSFLLLQQLTQWINLGYKVACFMLEDEENKHINRMVAQLSECSGLTDPDWCGANTAYAKSIPKDHKEFIEKLEDVLYTCDDWQPTLNDMAEWVERQCQAGVRVICIDPITFIKAEGRESWKEEGEFIIKLKQSAVRSGASILLISHPRTQVALPDLDSLAGSRSYGRRCSTGLWLEKHEPKTSQIKHDDVVTSWEHTLTLHILKSRDGRGQGFKIAMQFDEKSLTLSEIGIIIKEKKERKHKDE